MISDADLLGMATTFEVVPWDSARAIPQVVVERRRRKGHRDRWVITSPRDYCLTKAGEWVIEAGPGVEDYYWTNLREAITFAQEHMRKYPDGYKVARTTT